MKKRMFTAVVLLTVIALVFSSLPSCGEGIRISEGKEFTEAFFAAVSKKDTYEAQSYMHPDVEALVMGFFYAYEKEYGVDFQLGITVKRYSGVHSVYYDSNYEGSVLVLTAQTEIGDSSLDITVELVKNEAGYGIYNLTLGKVKWEQYILY